MKEDYESFEKFITNQELGLFESYCEEFNLDIRFEDFHKWIKENKKADQYEQWAWVKFESYKQNADETIWGDE